MTSHRCVGHQLRSPSWGRGICCRWRCIVGGGLGGRRSGGGGIGCDPQKGSKKNSVVCVILTFLSRASGSVGAGTTADDVFRHDVCCYCRRRLFSPRLSVYTPLSPLYRPFSTPISFSSATSSHTPRTFSRPSLCQNSGSRGGVRQAVRRARENGVGSGQICRAG